MVTITCTEALTARYHELLLEDWSPALPKNVLNLLLDAAHDAPQGLRSLFTESEGRAADWSDIVDRIQEASQFLDWPTLPGMPPYAKNRIVGAASLVPLRLSLALTLPAHFPVRGNTAFLADIQSLAFHAAMDVLTPRLRKGHSAEYGLLLRAGALFAHSYFSFDPSHAAYLLSLIHGHLGDVDRRIELLLASVNFTSPDDHSFLTKAQMYWSELIDAGRFREAQRFVFDLHWWALPRQRDEVEEMIMSAIQYMNQQKAGRTDRKQQASGRAGA